MARNVRQTDGQAVLMKYSKLVQVHVSVYHFVATLLIKLDINTTSKYDDSLIFPVGFLNIFTGFACQGYESPMARREGTL
jgi:hypothetical protein